MAPPGALPMGPEAMATTLPGNTVAMVAAAAGEEAGAEVEDPMEEDSYLVMCRFLLFFFTCLRLIPVSTAGRFLFFYFNTKKRFFGLPKYNLEKTLFYLMKRYE
jgi:hypothetical protein